MMRILCGLYVRSRAASSLFEASRCSLLKPAGLNCRLDDLEWAPGLWEAELPQTWPFLCRELKCVSAPAGWGRSSQPGLREGFLGPSHGLGVQPCIAGPLLELLSTLPTGADLVVWGVTDWRKNTAP